MTTSIGVRGLQLVGTVVMTHLLLPDDVGEVGVAVMVTVIINQFSLLGVPQYIVTRQKLSPDVAWHGTLLVGGVGLALVGVAVVFGGPLGHMLAVGLKAPHIASYMAWAIAAMFIYRIALIPERILQHQLRFRAVSLIRAVSESSYTIILLALAWRGYGPMSILIAHLSRFSLQFVLMAHRATLRTWLKPARLSVKTFKDILGFGVPFSIAAFLARFGQQGDKPLMSSVFGTGTAGAYQLAYNLADIPAVQVGEQIIDVLTPSLAQAEEQERKRELTRTTALSALVVFPLAIGLGAVAPTLVGAFLGKEWEQVGPMLTVLSALAVVRPLGWTVGTYLSATDRPKVQMMLGIVHVVVLFGSMLLFGHFLGPLWACVAVGIGFSAHALASVGYVVVKDGVPVWDFARGFVMPLGACVPMVAGVLGVRYALSRVGVDVDGVNLAAEIVVGAICYIAGALVIARPISLDLIALLKEAVAKRRGRTSSPPESVPPSA